MTKTLKTSDLTPAYVALAARLYNTTQLYRQEPALAHYKQRPDGNEHAFFDGLKRLGSFLAGIDFEN